MPLSLVQQSPNASNLSPLSSKHGLCSQSPRLCSFFLSPYPTENVSSATKGLPIAASVTFLGLVLILCCHWRLWSFYYLLKLSPLLVSMKVIFFQFVFLFLTDPLTSLSSRFFSMPKCGHLLSLCSFPVSELISGNPAVLMTYLASSPASPYSSWLRLLQTLLLASEGILSQVTNDWFSAKSIVP